MKQNSACRFHVTGNRRMHGAPLSNRRRAMLSTLALATALLCAPAQHAMAQPTSATPAPAPVPAILSDARVAAANPLPDFSYAGYGYGVAALPSDAGTVISVSDYGAVADDGLDDSAAVDRALAAAHAVNGPVTLRFPAGRFILSNIVRIERSNFTMEGAGPDAAHGGTELYFPRPLMMIDTGTEFDEIREYIRALDKRQVEPANNIDHYFSDYTWAGGFIRTGLRDSRHAPYLASYDRRLPVLATPTAGRQWQRTITVADASALRVGQVVQLQWYPVDGERSAIIRSIYGDTDLAIGSHHWSFPDRPLVTQSTRITAISGNRITIGDPLLHDIRADQPAVIAEWQHIENVGIQGFQMSFPDAPAFAHHLEQGYNAIFFNGVFDGWVRDVHFHNADSSILTYNSASATFRDLMTSGNRRAHYTVHVGNAHNILVSDLVITNPAVHSLSVNTQSTRAVFRRVEVFADPVLDQHAGANHQNLFDQVTFHAAARMVDGIPTIDVWNGSGASYWEPGHGRYNTTWNLRVDVTGGARVGETVRLRAVSEGPGGRIVGITGNRPFTLDYRPQPYSEGVNQSVAAVPSLYDYQLARRVR